MIAYIALVLSIINSILWVVLAVGIQRVFKKLLPVFQSFGIAPTQNLKYSSSYAKMRVAPELTDAESEKQ